jgi:hypothetical protein
MLKRRPAFTRVRDDGRICLINNAAERALRELPSGAELGYSLAQTAAANAPP